MEFKKDKLTGKRDRGERRATAGGALTGMLPLIPLWTGLALTARDTFPSLPLPWWEIALAGLLLSAALFLLRGSAVRQWVMPGGLALTLIFCLVFRRPVFSGLETLANDVLTRLTATTGRIHLEYTGAGSVLPALIPAAVLLALLFTEAALRGSLWPLLPAAAALIAGTAFGIVPAGPGWALFALGIILVAGSGGSRSFKATAGRVAAAAVCAALALGLGLLMKNADLSGWKDAAALRVHEWRYDSGTNSMPEGRIADIGPWKKSDAAALEVTMGEPQKLYLRGHTYEVYTGSAWESLPGEELSGSEALFYWLHESGFYSQSQIAKAMETGGAAEPQRMTVKNISACAENAYLPYMFADTGDLDAAVIGDTKTGKELTDFACYSGSLPEMYEAQYLLCASQDDPDTAAYLAMEESYRGYVTAHDLQLTQESWNVLYRQFGDVSGTRSLYEIQMLIRDYLSRYMHYDEKVYTLSRGGDFLHYVLESSDGGGWSVQYATAAALMLRYYGVPSRYVEGYYLTPEQAERAAAGEPVTLTEMNAHAWAELYLNGVGFVPFEVTPGYIDPEDMDSGEAADENGGRSELFEYEANQMTYAQIEEPVIKTPEVGEKDKTGPSPLLWLLIPAGMLILLAAVLRRRLRLRKKLREIELADDRDAVAMRYGYAMALKQRAEDPPLPEDEEAARLNELALFSRREITKAERARMDDYAENVLAACREQWKLPQKLRFRWIEGIY